MTLKGSSLGTVINGTSRDVVDIVNWSKLTWNIDGLGSTTLAFDASYVSSALVNADGTSITVQLNSVGTKALHELTDFGGLATSGGTPDTLNVDTGFLRDLAVTHLRHRRPLLLKFISQTKLPRHYHQLKSMAHLLQQTSRGVRRAIHSSLVTH